MLFEGVKAIKLRTSYPGLMLRPAAASARGRLMDYAGVPDSLRARQLCLTLPAERDGFVVCGKATVLAGRQPPDQAGWRRPEPAATLHVFTAGDAKTA